MDIVYASFCRRRPVEQAPPGEVAEVLGALWAHTVPDDGLEHASGRAEPERVDLILYLLTTDAANSLQRADALLTRCHQASPLLYRRFWRPRPLPEQPSA